MVQIEIDDDVWRTLKFHAEPFVDNPNSVLRRLLRIDEGDAPRPSTDFAGPAAAATGVPVASAPRPRSRQRGARAGGQKRTRAPAGSLLSEREYELPLLRALADAGGRAPYREVVDAVGRELKDQLMPLDFEQLKSGGVRWQSRLQFVRLRLIERGLLERDTPRGVWGISEAGQKMVERGTLDG